MEDKKDLLSIGKASEYLGISIDTLRRWEKKGRIEPFRSPGGHRYYEKNQLDNLFGKKYERDEPTIRTKKEVQPEQKTQEKDKVTTIEVEEKEEFFIQQSQTKDIKVPESQPLQIRTEQVQPINNSLLTPVFSDTSTQSVPSPVPRNIDHNVTKENKSNRKVLIIVGLTVISVVIAIVFVFWTSSKQILSPIP